MFFETQQAAVLTVTVVITTVTVSSAVRCVSKKQATLL